MDLRAVRENLFVGYEYTPQEVKADALVHAGGIMFALFAVPWLVAESFSAKDWQLVLATCVYGFAMLAVLTVSAAYNLSIGPIHDRLRPFDHAVIFILIAGSYSPYLVMSLPGDTALWLGAFIWGGAVLGMVGKIAFPKRFDLAYIPLYLALGWAGVWALEPLAEALLPANFALLVAGGVLYTAGVPFYLLERLPYHNAIWHCFVLGGVVTQYTAVAGEVTRLSP